DPPIALQLPRILGDQDVLLVALQRAEQLRMSVARLTLRESGAGGLLAGSVPVQKPGRSSVTVDRRDFTRNREVRLAELALGDLVDDARRRDPVEIVDFSALGGAHPARDAAILEVDEGERRSAVAPCGDRNELTVR